MEKINSRKHQPPATAARNSPRLIRSRSGSPAVSTSLPTECSSPNLSLNRSRSTGKHLKITSYKADQELIQDDSIKFLQRIKRHNKIEAVPRKARSASSSPSAWALSPGRNPPPLPMAPSPVQIPLVPKSPVSTGKLKKELCRKGKSVSGVLNYFRQKKISPIQEEEYYNFCVMHNRLLQWRFANARAEVSMMAAKRNSEKKLFNVWARIAMIRKLVAEKRIQVQKLKQEMKINRIVGLQIHLLKEWGRLESKNFEAVGRLARKLSAISTCLPLVHDAKVNTIPLHDTMCMAMRVMENIEATIIPIQLKVERICYLITELSIVSKVETDMVNKLAKLLATIASLKTVENSLKVHCVQLIS